MLPWRKSIHLIFLGEKTDSGTKPGFHGNLRHRNCSLPQSHSLLCAGSALSSQSSESFQQAKATEEHSLFPTGFVFSVFVCWNGNSNTHEGRNAQLGQGGKPGPQHPAVRSALPGNLQPVCWIPTIWNYFWGPSFVLQWCITRLDEIPWFMSRDTANGLGNPCFKGHVQNSWFLFSWLVCSVHTKIKSLSTGEKHFGYIQGKDLESQPIMAVRNITPLLKSA